MRLLNYAMMLGLGAAMVGCTSGSQAKGPYDGDSDAAANARLAAYAASHKYPSTKPSNELRAAAMVNRETGAIRIANFSPQSLRDVNVWVNGGFVKHLDMIPASGVVTLQPVEFYDASGRTMAAQKTSPVSVQLETPDGFYALQGPIFE